MNYKRVYIEMPDNSLSIHLVPIQNEQEFFLSSIDVDREAIPKCKSLDEILKERGLCLTK